LIDCLGLTHMDKTVSKPVIFIGPNEHHSNLLPWRESGCEIVMIPESSATHSIDLEILEHLLHKYVHRPWKLGTFTAASNVTGKVVDTNAITFLLHKYGALSIWDYATGAAYLNMNMNPTMSMEENTTNPASVAKDAIFFSPHKMLGGVGTPGVLVVKKHLMQPHNPPKRSGGGTVFYVSPTHHRFLSNRVERYEGGTPNVLGIWRVGLTMLAKRNVEQEYLRLVQQQRQRQQQDPLVLLAPPTVLDYEYQTFRQVSQFLQNIPNLVLLGDAIPIAKGSTDSNLDSKQQQPQPHLPIFSFLIKCGPRFLHYNYVCAILNDVFGIQSRGGCQCAGPYSQRLLGLTEWSSVGSNGNGSSKGTVMEEIPNAQNVKVEHALVHFKERAELLRPGYTRLSLPFKGLSSDQVEYVKRAIEWTAQNAWMLLPQYRCNHRTGEWRHKSRQGAPLGKRERKWLSHYQLQQQPSLAVDQTNAEAAAAEALQKPIISIANVLEQTFENANALLEAARTDHPTITQALKMVVDGTTSLGGGDDDVMLEELRWFVYPKEVATFVSQGLAQVPGTNSKDNLLGALRPTVWYPPTTFSFSPGTFAVDVSATKVDEPHNEVSKLAMETDSGAPNVLYSFRDGENHSGDAPMDDIEAGFDDGELSEACHIYISEEDAWMSIRAFLEKAKSEENKMPLATPVDMDIDDDDHNDDVVKTDEMKVTAASLIQTANLPLDEKNQKKKPSRDSSTWGQGSFVPVKPPVVPPTPTSTTTNGGDAPPAAEHLPPGKKKKTRHIKPPPKMMRLVTQAMIQWDMLEEGDRLLLGLSGGKDSLSLLHCLLEFQRKLPIKFEIEVCTIDPMTPSFDPSPMIPYVESLGLKYHYIRENIVERANNAGKDGQMVSSLCAFCARMKRGNLYACARQNNCNKLVLAQHLDDLAESFMMSVMHNGFLRTMKANYKINAGDLSVIRPLVYCRESVMTEFAKSANLPVINENCPACFEEPKERARIKKLLSREETLFPNFYDNIKRAMLPLMHDDATAILRSYTEEALAKSRRENHVKKRPNWNDHPNGKKAKSDSQENSTDAGGNQQTKKAPLVLTSLASSDSTKAKETESKLLAGASEEELLRELTRRRADRFRLAGSMKRLEDNDDDQTGQVCTLNGGNGSIPCRELME
jgi:tRNA(Ile)-lysidine synthase TilS/MesJ/selenocysteine lyase/cysteine desulfurase